jgi:hypothetical protein
MWLFLNYLWAHRERGKYRTVGHSYVRCLVTTIPFVVSRRRVRSAGVKFHYG